MTLDSEVLGNSACRPANARYPVKGWPRDLVRVASLPLEGYSPSSIARGHPTRCRPEAAVLAGGYPRRTWKPSRRPRSSPPRRRHHHEAYTSCRDLYALGEVTVSCMLTSFAPVLSDEPSHRTHHAYMIWAGLSSQECHGRRTILAELV